MLYLHQSNRLENLAHTFTAFQKNQPLADPFAKEQIVVQSRGMGRYLHVFLAKEIGIAANLKLTLPASFSWQLMVSVLPGLQPNSPFATEAMAWRLFGYFQANLHSDATVDPVFEPLRHYLALGEEAAFDLANKLADIFDQYLVYRPQWIQTWEAGRLNDLGEHEPWQARLWQYLSEHPAPHRVRMWDQLLAALPQAKTEGRLPERINIFGIATLAPMYIELFNQLAQYIDVHLFALNPSEEHWGHVIEPAMILQLAPEQQSLSETGHPLLASLGKQGRDFFDALSVDMMVGHDIDVFEEDEHGSLLQQLQSDLLHLRLPDASHNALLSDGSIQIHSAHSPLRELQILKNQLLALLAQNPGLSHQDIAVLTPNIDAYAPFIEALFGQHDGQPYLPFTLTDTKILSSHPFLFAFAALLTLLDGRFELDPVLALLDAEPLRRRFNLNERDIEVIRQHVAHMNIHWGLDETMRRQYGGQDDAFTWAQGLERLILGFMLPSRDPKNGAPLLWSEKAPSGLSHQHMTVLAQFSVLLQTLGDIHVAWQQPTSMDGWWQRIQNSIQALFLFDEDDQMADGHLQQSLQKLIESVHLAQSHELTVGFPIVKAHILHYLDSKNDASFLRGGITFCSMVPMRSLPFKVLCLIGLNDGEFPRDEKADSFDLIAAHPKKGDRSRRNDDQYLFLEALMSARQVLYLSYIGRSIKNNDPLPPSTLVSELIDTVANMTGQLPQTLHDEWVLAHPLQPFSKSYFNASNKRLFSYDERLADALNQPARPTTPFLSNLALAVDEPKQLALAELLAFWRNPVRSWLNQTLGLYPTYWAKEQTPHEPFSLDAGQQARIHQAFLQAKLTHRPYEDTSAYLQAIDALPVGELGALINETAQSSIKKLSLPEAVLSPKLAHTPIQIRVNNTLISGYLGELHQAGQVFLAAQSMNAPTRVNQLLLHVLLNATRPQGLDSYETHVFYMDKDGNSVYQTYAEMPPEQALNLLEQWLAYHQAGLSRPLPFFARTSLASADAYWDTLQKTDSTEQAQEQALKTARGRFIGNHHSPGQQQDQEVAMVFGGKEPLDDPEFMRLITDLLVAVLALGQR